MNHKTNNKISKNGRFVFNYKSDRKPIEIWKLDKEIRKWNAESAMSNKLIGLHY